MSLFPHQKAVPLLQARIARSKNEEIDRAAEPQMKMLERLHCFKIRVDRHQELFFTNFRNFSFQADTPSLSEISPTARNVVETFFGTPNVLSIFSSPTPWLSSLKFGNWVNPFSEENWVVSSESG